MTAPTSNLLRANCTPQAVEIRSSEEGDVLVGHFAVFNQPTEINSRYEGHFMEQFAPGAFDRSIADRGSKIKVLFEHGKDPSVGNKPLGTIRSIRSDATGYAYEVDLFDTPYVNELKPAIRAGAFGASHRFSIADDGETWQNRGGDLPLRTVTNADLYEFSAVTFPAYDGATAGMRSLTDQFLDDWMRDATFVARLTERVGPRVVEKMLADVPTGLATEQAQAEDLAARAHAQARRQWLARHLYSKDTQ